MHPRRYEAETERLKELERQRMVTGAKPHGWVDLKRDLSVFPITPGIKKGIRYVNRFGYHAAVPMDVLHTVPNGIGMILKSILIQYASKFLCFASK